MRFINILTSLLLLIIIFSCNNNINKNGIENQLIVHIELKIVQDDVLELYFDNRETNTFSSKKSIRKKIKGSNSFQKVSFILDKDAYPNRIRIDLGENRSQETIEIKEIGLQYNNATHTFSNEEIDKLFKPNIYLDYRSLMATPKQMNGNYDPYLESFNLSKYINELIHI